KFEELQQSVDDKQDELIDTLAQKYQENLEAVDARIEEMKAANKGFIQKAFDFIVGVIKTIIELTKMLLEVLARVAGVIGQILKNPIGFLTNLIQALKQGFLNFMNNIGKHLQQGLIGWLTGTMAETGIQMPENLDIKGIFSLAMQLLGFTYEAIRAQAVKKLGEEKVGRLEQTVDVFQVLASQGVVGMWQFVQEKIGDLNALVIEPIKNFIIEKVITAGIEWILSLLTPASAFIKAAKAIYEIVKFFIERAQQIADLINAILDAIAAIASGAIDQAIKGVENALAKSLPVVISFLASLLGLDGIAGKIQAIFQKLRKPMEKAVDWVIDKGAKAFKKVGNKVKNSKFGKKAGELKDSAKEKYQAGKQWVEDKKETGQNWVNDKKAAAEQWVNDKKEGVKNKFKNSKFGKKVGAVAESAKEKYKAGKQWVEDKKQAGQNWVNDKKEAAHNWVEGKKKSVKDKFDKFGNKVKDKLGFGKDKDKEKQDKPEQKNKQDNGKETSKKDEKQHQLLAQQAVLDMKNTEGIAKDYKTLRAEKQAQAKQIEKTYTAKLEKGIKLSILFEDAARDEKDKDLDFKVVIAPNTTILPSSIPLSKSSSDYQIEAKNIMNDWLFIDSHLSAELNITLTKTQSLIQEWVTKDKVLFGLKSRGPRDPNTVYLYSFSKAKAEAKYGGMRDYYGYDNPPKDSAKGLAILSKGFNNLTPQPIEPTNKNYHKTQARYRSMRPGSTYTDFGYKHAILGHDDSHQAAAEHWNDIGHTQTKKENRVWNQNPNNYWGPEHTTESSASGSGTPFYVIPCPSFGSHEDWW
ncbi:hypothetical protein IQ229_10480, partial [Nostoc cf. edaphicum LEGE 07299]